MSTRCARLHPLPAEARDPEAEQFFTEVTMGWLRGFGYTPDPATVRTEWQQLTYQFMIPPELDGFLKPGDYFLMVSVTVAEDVPDTARLDGMVLS